MNCAVILADHAAVYDGKLSVNGGAWNSMPLPVRPMALAMIFDVDWSETNLKYQVSVELQDEDGQKVLVPTTSQPLKVEMSFEVGRPPGARPEMPQTAAVAMNVGPLPLLAGKAYSWRVTVMPPSGNKPHIFVRQFSVIPAPGQGRLGV